MLNRAPVESLVSYMEAHATELAGDLLPSLVDVDSVFREIDQNALARAVSDVVVHFTQYCRRRDTASIDAAFRAFQILWPAERTYFSASVRVFFGLEDLVALRASNQARDHEGLIDELRLLRVCVREALCHASDRLQGRFGGQRPAAVSGPIRAIEPHAFEISSLTLDHSPPPDELEARLPASSLQSSSALTGSEAVALVCTGAFVGRAGEMMRLWERMTSVGAAGAAHHEVVAIKAPEGYGKSRLLQHFEAFVQEQLGTAPIVLRARSPRLFSLPLWPVAQLLRTYFGVTIGDPELPGRVQAGLTQLLEYLPDGSARAQLLEARVFLLDILGDPEAARQVGRMDGRTVGIRLKRAVVNLVEAVAARAAVETTAPLLVVLEDADEMDGPSWELVHHLLTAVRPRARMMVLMTYGGRFFVPAELGRYPGFTELILEPFNMTDGEALIDALLPGHMMSEASRFRLIAGARGAPLVLCQAVRQLVEDEVLGVAQDRWIELKPLPGEEVLRDLGTFVSRRCARLGSTAVEVAELVAVVEDATGGGVLEEVASRRAVGADELDLALAQLERAGLVERLGAEGGQQARIIHSAIHDEIYRRTPAERRRTIHEDAGEVYSRMPCAASYPSLAADHLALAGLPGRALHGLLTAIDRCVRSHNLVGALELCSQSIGLLKGLARDDQDRFMFHVVVRRERVHSMLGLRETQADDLRQLEPLAQKVATEAERVQLAQRRARHALLSGQHDVVDAALLAQGGRPTSSAKFVLALNDWQQGHKREARGLLEELVERTPVSELTERQRARLFHARGLVEAREGRLTESLRWLFEAWRSAHRAGDVFGEALTIQALGNHFWTTGRLMDADRMLRRADKLLAESAEVRARSRVLVQLGHLHASMGDFDEAMRAYGDVLQLGDRETHRLDHSAALIGQGKILVSRGRYEEATALVAQCMKDLGRRAIRHPIQVDVMNAMAMTFAVAARGERLIVGALNYANDAADRATELGYQKGLVVALGIQVRALLALGRNSEAESRLGDLDTAYALALQSDPRLERLRAEVELYRHGVCKARGDLVMAEQARQAAWNELMAQVRCLEGTGLERGFMSNILPHREILLAMERHDAPQA